MVKELYESLAAKVRGLNIFEYVSERVELIENDSGTWPAEFNGNDSYEILNPGKFSGFGYFRPSGTINIEGNTDSLVPCEDIHTATIPMVFVGFIKRSLLKCKAEFASDYLLELLISELLGRDSDIDNATGTKDVNVRILSCDNILSSILKSEFGNSDVDYSYSSVKIELSVIVKFDKNCIDLLCDESVYV